MHALERAEHVCISVLYVSKCICMCFCYCMHDYMHTVCVFVCVSVSGSSAQGAMVTTNRVIRYTS